MVKVVHIFGLMDLGGAEIRTLELMKTLQPQGVTFDFFTLSGRNGALDDEIRD